MQFREGILKFIIKSTLLSYNIIQLYHKMWFEMFILMSFVKLLCPWNHAITEIENIYIIPQSSLVTLPSQFLHCRPRQPLICFLSLYIMFAFSRISFKWNHTVDNLLCLDFFSLNDTFFLSFFRFIHVVECIIVYSFCFLVVFFCLYIPVLFTHPPDDGHLYFFKFGTNVNLGAMNICVSLCVDLCFISIVKINKE